MKKLIVLVGMQGAGKTTVLNGFRGGKVLKPSTMRAQRDPAEDEYYFETAWNVDDFAWTIQRNQINYGMRWSEIRSFDNVGITVFDPAALGVLKASTANSEFEIVTVGLDTIASVADQHIRVVNAASRMIQTLDFDAQRDMVTRCDIVLSGDENRILAAVEAVALLLGGRGGVLSSETMKPLILAGALLGDADVLNLEPASYDLRIADTYWCQGKYHTLTKDNPVLTIPPYSFALVQAREQARLPRFIVAMFDIRVSLFFSGVVLSNGPQVDPGYSGDLFCMLHNASGSDVGINRDAHFASIQFQTLATNSAAGYNAQYQNKKGFKHFLAGSDSRKPGGQILERVNAIEKKFGSFKTNVIGTNLAIMAIMASICIWFADKAINSAAEKATASMESVSNTAAERLTATQKQIDEALAKLKQGRPK